MEYDLDQFDPERLEGPDRPGPGSFHFEVLELQPEDPKSGALWADNEVLSGTTPDQEGKVHREYISNTPASVGRIMQFAVALGLISVDELRQHKADGTAPNIDWSQAIGRQFCGKIEEETYQGKTRGKLNFNIWPVDSPKAKGIPLNEGKLMELRRRLSEASDEPFGSPGGKASTDEPPLGPVGSDSSFGSDDLF